MERIANILLNHFYLNNDATCTVGDGSKLEDNPFPTDFIKNHEYTIDKR